MKESLEELLILNACDAAVIIDLQLLLLMMIHEELLEHGLLCHLFLHQLLIYNMAIVIVDEKPMIMLLLVVKMLLERILMMIVLRGATCLINEVVWRMSLDRRNWVAVLLAEQASRRSPFLDVVPVLLGITSPWKTHLFSIYRYWRVVIVKSSSGS